jgi:hypothetical protein
VGEKDAALFASAVYKSADILQMIQASTFLGGVGAMGLGLLLLLLTCLVTRPRCVSLPCLAFAVLAFFALPFAFIRRGRGERKLVLCYGGWVR